ncbi:S8 family serine peptidase [Aquirufa aurantiipilula]|uniref:S8 family serine peptidase n=1 Tax=Aquirufa aurantiipilula TaxID=2696561 RepID=UPI001CAA54A9|nr:S8 family serine peptidase [Aquirufa aurantiipilula]MBZ1327360.1 S8 family serine peptidase [Aquirufa aurantiipilula]
MRTKPLLSFFSTIILWICASLWSFGQGELYPLERRKAILNFANQYSSQKDSLYLKVQQLAAEKGIASSAKIGKRSIYLQSINPNGKPIYKGVFSNKMASVATKTNQFYSGGSLGLNLTGKSDSLYGKLAVWDEQTVRTSHQELTGRVLAQEKSITFGEHSTHVGGTMIASGIFNPEARGMAFEATLKSWDFQNDDAKISAASPNLLISNHSYGAVAGWSYDEDVNKYRWFGDDKMSVTEDYVFGFYDDDAQAKDKIAYNSPYYLMVAATGNSADENGPPAGQYYLIGNSKDSSNVVRGTNTGFNTVGSPATAKNMLSVGAAEPLTSSPVKPSDVTVTSFSSRGPTDDGRIKPEIIGIGKDLFSTGYLSNTDYERMSGTSMATPQVSGSLFLLQQLSLQLNKKFMWASTLRGLVTHTAFDVGQAGPDYTSGWGLLDMEKAGKMLQNQDKSYLITEESLTNGASKKMDLIASGKGPLHVTIAWTDPAYEGSNGKVLPIIPSSLNSRIPMLMNDLDIRLQSADGQLLPFILDPDNPTKAAVAGDNIRDNIEQILVSNVVPGKSYSLTVSHKGTLKNSKQDYALLISGMGGKAYCSITAQNKSNALEKFTLGTYSNSVSTSQDFTQNAIPVEIGSKIPIELKYSTAQSKQTKVFVDWNQDGDFEDSDEMILNSGILTATSFSGNASNFPATETGQYYRMRVVTELGNSATLAAACGNIGSGEIEEYVIQTANASNDISALSITSSTGNFCASSTSSSFSIVVKNQGLKDQVKVPYELKILQNGVQVGSSSGTIAEILSGKEAEETITGNFNLQAGQTYTFELLTSLANDQNTGNNSYVINETIENPRAPIVSGIQCVGLSELTLSATSGTPLWYNSDNTLVGSGLNIKVPINSKYTASYNDFSGGIGPKTKSEFGGGTYYTTFGPTVIVEAKVPIILESARIYVGTSGKITFDVINKETGNVVSTVTKTVKATRTLSSAGLTGQLVDDKNDSGMVITLNLQIPDAGTYYLSQTCLDGASIYRSNRTKSDTINAATNIGFPYTIPNILNIPGALFNGGVITSGYYYFYDMKFKSLGCPSPRAAVVVSVKDAPTASINPFGDLTVCQGASVSIQGKASDNTLIQWYLNGKAITGATSLTYKATTKGKFEMVASYGGSCPVTTQALNINVGTVPTPAVTYSSGILQAPANASVYQWYFGITAISGANQASYIPVQTGAYQVKVTDANGCLAVSDYINVVILATKKENPFQQLTLFPNPTKEYIQLGLPDQAIPDEYHIEIWDLQGKKVLEKIINSSAISGNSISLDVRILPSGSYLLRMADYPTQAPVKFIKY